MLGAKREIIFRSLYLDGIIEIKIHFSPKGNSFELYINGKLVSGKHDISLRVNEPAKEMFNIMDHISPALILDKHGIDIGEL